MTQSSQRRLSIYGNPAATQMKDGRRGIFVYTCGHQASHEPVNACRKARWRHFRGLFLRRSSGVLVEGVNADAGWLRDVKNDARQRGVRG